MLDNVTLPHTSEDIEFAALVTGAEPATVLARYSNGNPAILATAGANGPPVATDAAVTVAEDGSVSIVLAGTDPDGDPLTITVTVMSAYWSIVAGVYTPAPNYHGLDSIEFTVDDGRGGTDTGDDRDHGDAGERPACLLAGLVRRARGRAAQRDTRLHRRRRCDAEL